MLFPFMHQRNSRKYIPQGLKAEKLARPMSGLKPGPTQLRVFPQALQSGEAGFQTRENALSRNDRALALVSWPINPYVFRHRHKCWVPHLPRFPAEACGVDTLHAPFLNERRTRGPLWHSVAGKRSQARVWLEWDNGSPFATSPRSHFSEPLLIGSEISLYS